MSVRRRRSARLLFVAFALGAALIAPGARPSYAAPTIWTRARDPELDRSLAAMSRAEALLLKYRRLLDPRVGESFAGMGAIYLQEARRILEAAGAESSRDPRMRFRLAEVLFELRQSAQAAKIYETVVRSPGVPAALRASGLADLGICYARLGRHSDEIKAYTEALKLETRGSARAVVLANRAEAYMVLGDIDRALEGYRAALSSLLAIEMFRIGVTTLWGLAVALDRSGDLDTSLTTIRLARDYDPMDRLINGPGWFYATPHDEDWYKALGYWAKAREAQLLASRSEAYARAVERWESYIERAPADDRWLPLAKARLDACQRDREVAAQRARDAATQKARPPRPAAPSAGGTGAKR